MGQDPEPPPAQAALGSGKTAPRSPAAPDGGTTPPAPTRFWRAPPGSRGTTSAAPAPAGDEKKDGDSFPFPPGLAAAIALVVAGLTAVGVSGDTLTRAVRNEPTKITWSIIVALGAAAALVALNLGEKRWTAWWKHPSTPPAKRPRWPGVLVAFLVAVLGLGLVVTIAVAMLTGAE